MLSHELARDAEQAQLPSERERPGEHFQFAIDAPAASTLSQAVGLVALHVGRDQVRELHRTECSLEVQQPRLERANVLLVGRVVLAELDGHVGEGHAIGPNRHRLFIRDGAEALTQPRPGLLVLRAACALHDLAAPELVAREPHRALLKLAGGLGCLVRHALRGVLRTEESHRPSPPAREAGHGSYR